MELPTIKPQCTRCSGSGVVTREGYASAGHMDAGGLPVVFTGVCPRCFERGWVEYGLYDTVDSVWLGDERGPSLYLDQPDLNPARPAMANRQFGYPPGRIVLRAWEPRFVRVCGTVMPVMDAMTALEKLKAAK